MHCKGICRSGVHESRFFQQVCNLICCFEDQSCSPELTNYSRLELLAALLLARLLSNTMQALQPEQKLNKTSCYTDSKIVLYWIRGNDKEWKQFVENRVREIRTLIPAKCWHHCCGDLNPADLPSRGVEGTEPSKIGSWLKIPQHICEPDQAPCSPELNTIPEACAMEQKAGDQTFSMTVHSVVEKLL